jgi:hypothetical protein
MAHSVRSLQRAPRLSAETSIPDAFAAPGPVNSCPAESMKPRQRPSEAARVAGAPGWYVISRAPPASSGDPTRWSRRFRLAAVAVTAALPALLFVLSMVRAQWSEVPAGQTVMVSMAPLVISPGPRSAPRLTPAPAATTEEPTRPQDTVATAVLQTKPDPVLPDELALLPVESVEVSRSTAEWESRSEPAGLSAARLPPTIGGSPSPAQEPRKEPIQPSRSSPPVTDHPANLRSAATIQVASQASRSDDDLALPAGEIRIFIHHVADHAGGAALAQRLADYLRGQGFTVADIRPVDFRIGKPSVRYFFARDRAASQRLVEELGRFSGGRTSLAPDQASDFTHFLPKPRPGSVEVWLPAS